MNRLQVMSPKENYLHEFLRIFFANRQLIKRVFLVFALITLAMPLLLKQSFDITAEVLVQSKKLPQSDVNTALSQETDKFLPPSLADMETESNILRSPSLMRETIGQLHEEGVYSPSQGVFHTLVLEPLRAYVANPLREHVINPLRSALGLEVDPVRDGTIDALTEQASAALTVETLPGSNVISVSYSSVDPELGTRLVNRLLENYLKSRQNLQSSDLPESFFEQKKSQYQERIGELEERRRDLLESIGASDPKEEITFRLNAINTEEQALNLYRDRLLESQRWLDYLTTNLTAAREASFKDATFPFTFTHTVDNAAYEDREIKQLGEKLIELIGSYGNATASFQEDSLPVQQQRERIARTRGQFLKVVENRILERNSELTTLQQVIAQKTERIDQYKARVRDLQNVQAQLRLFDTEIDALHKAFFTYTQRYEESRSQGLLDGSASNARVLSWPYEPSEPSFPKPMLIVPLGLLTGLLLAVALGYLREFFDHRFKHPAQLTEHLGLPVLMVINEKQVAQAPAPQAWTWPWIWHWIRQ